MRVSGTVSALLAVLGLTLVLSACDGDSKSSTATDTGRTRVAVSVTQCGQGWINPSPGQQHFVLADTDIRAGEVTLTDARTGDVYADVEPIAPGTTANLDIHLGSGSYAFHCAMEDEDTVVGPTVVVAGNVKGSAVAVTPVSQVDLLEAVKQYESYVKGQLPLLVEQTDALRSAIGAGNRAAAESAWLPAHLQYERLGAAYQAFGDLDGEINGVPTGLPAGVNDAHWEGFHRIEYGLWHGENMTGLAPHADKLADSVTVLVAEFANAQIDPLTVSIRAHEITENALQFELTGHTDYGSNSNLATVRANLDGTTTVLSILQSLLTKRDSQLPVMKDRLAQSKADLDALSTSGVYPPLSALSSTQRERIDADISELSEQLAPIASILEPRRNS
ncbi:MAG: EfeM/EfeO family lipoprotein [Actinobacteria bacterium]|nr:EfeM/EfeO family lipoprotein [Actinomycetota bacterium]